MPRRGPTLTTPDLVVLSYLAERAMHGYELNERLVEHEVRDWAGISRPQVYYSLRKLADAKLIAPAADADAALGPERRVYRTTKPGRTALAAALGRPEWSTQRPPPPFLTWLALSPHAPREVVRAQVARRRAFLEAEHARETATLAWFETHDAARSIGAAMVGLAIRQFALELVWLDELEQRLYG